MAIKRRPRPDAMENPPARRAAQQKQVEAVLGIVRRMGESVLSLFTGLLAAALILYSGYVLYDTFYTQNRAYSSSYELLQYRPDIIEDEAVPLEGGDTFISINRDYRAWITVYDTYIDYPVMQGRDNQFYTNHDVYKNVSLTGAIYLAAKNSRGFTDPYNLIYGHHMDNGAMFGALDNFANAGYLYSHRKGLLVSSTTVYDLNIFATVSTHAYEDIVYRSHETDLDTLLDFIEKNAVVKDMAAAKGARQILAMSTCAGSETNGRLVVFATMTPRDMSRLPEPYEDNPLQLTLTGYQGVFDGHAHEPGVSVSMSDAKLEYSINGGVTWSSVVPSIRNVGTVSVMARALHDSYPTATAETVLRVDPAVATVRARPSAKNYGTEDPAFTADVEGLIDNDILVYTVQRLGTQEDVGVYANVIVPQGEQLQGNYTVTYIPASFRIVSRELAFAVGGSSFVYDGQPHTIPVTLNHDGALIEYSVDGGATWTIAAPAQTDVGSQTVKLRLSAPGYETVLQDAVLEITPRSVTVTANAATKMAGTEDPAFTAQVNGLIGDDTVEYGFRREAGETVGTYGLFTEGNERQGNYVVTFVSGTLTITEAPPAPTEPPEPAPEPSPEPEDIEEPETPLAAVIERFRPTGSTHGEKAWALLNLLLTFFTVYILVPLSHLKAKFGRARQMTVLNLESTEKVFNTKGFRIRFWIAMVLETLLSSASVAIYVMTEDMTQPMVLIDKWTPVQLLILAVTWIVDITLTSVHNKEFK